MTLSPAKWSRERGWPRSTTLHDRRPLGPARYKSGAYGGLGTHTHSIDFSQRRALQPAPPFPAPAPTVAAYVPSSHVKPVDGGLPPLFSPLPTGSPGDAIVNPAPRQFLPTPRPLVPAPPPSTPSEAIGQPSHAIMVYDQLGFHRQTPAGSTGAVAPEGADALPYG